MEATKFIVRVATEEDIRYTDEIIEEIANSAKIRGTGIARRTPEYVSLKMREGKAVVAITDKGEWAGFCYIEVWSHEKFVANSGLIVSQKFRGQGLSKKIKGAIFNLSRKRYPEAKIFGLTTGAAVMKINSELGYKPVIYSELTQDEDFWKGCQSCVNFDILTAKNRQNCICTAMLYNPAWEQNVKPKRTVWVERELDKDFNLFQRWVKFKKSILLKPENKKKNSDDK
ncbi:MAG: GNAT family N-acetyltransferase [Cytophagales bacterium CG12_big_fil_rev_8_21_14_0_65_40_12]|uniref:GNAT family N-acetyltransferase n=1 Tax=Roseivirga sp. TaxID=1964215 RepID=UPI000C604AE4|nr:MAG: GNAT family N-acetyltransferase [Cytophagales bacterium CG12_big_fil_rev_8_21_14_0_65_40_12]PIW05116.1 MAG: GNAT family N-acetyltransferase [Cytophagales bacterium CG17_big_fil_post_rev_8_21_14_2_50_40_13]